MSKLMRAWINTTHKQIHKTIDIDIGLILEFSPAKDTDPPLIREKKSRILTTGVGHPLLQ